MRLLSAFCALLGAFFDPIQHFVHIVQLILKYECKKDWVFLLLTRFVP
jgi:hypothetical protein